MDDQPGLFLDLPTVAPPLYLYADEHVLEPCWRCDGSGQERPPPWWSKTRVALFWDPACRECNGVGKRLRFVGRVRDVVVVSVEDPADTRMAELFREPEEG